MYEGVGLDAAVAAVCGGWTVPVHCATAAIIKISCVNDEMASVAVWKSGDRLFYATTRARRDTIYYTANATLMASATGASRMFATVLHHYGHLQVAISAGVPAFEWAPTEAVLVTTAVGMAAALTTALKTRRHHLTWIVDFLDVPPVSVVFEPTRITVNSAPVVTFDSVVFTGPPATPWGRLTPKAWVDGAGCVADLASALVAHHTRWTNRLTGTFC